MTVAVPLSTCKNTNYVSDCNLLHEKCPNTDMFLVRVFLIWAVYGDLLRKSPYSVQIQENTDHKKTPYLDTFQAVLGRRSSRLIKNWPLLNAELSSKWQKNDFP